MKPKTQEQMLTDIVRAMIDGGWKDNQQEIIYFNIYSGDKELNPSEAIKGYRIGLTALHKILKDKDTKSYYNISLPDLLANKDALKAAYGDECIWIDNGYIDWEGKPYNKCAKSVSTCRPAHYSDCAQAKRWKYVSLEAFKILQAGGDAIKYLWEQLKGGENSD
jgi:hypothetical protein